MIRKSLYVLLVFVALLWALNTSTFIDRSEGDGLRLLAHRGVHQRFPLEGVGNDTCTARLIGEPVHAFLENTVPSMEAAFAAGADVVELDIHLTPDGSFAVFHDWTLDCRTDGTGVTEKTPMTVIRGLDAGYGYTADGGRTFPLRGKGIGMIPTLEEVVRAFPGRKFLVNFKSNRAEEGEVLAARLQTDPAWRDAVFAVYGGAAPTQRALSSVPGLKGYGSRSIVACLGRYEAYGWTGIVPESCRDTIVAVPVNYTWLIWGWPHRFTRRMRAAGTDVILVGPYGGGFSTGIDSVELLDMVPAGFDGFVWTNDITTIAEAVRARADRSGR